MSRYLYREYLPCRNIHKFKNWIEIDVDIIKEDMFNELNGTFLQITSNPQFDPPNGYHWFDGDGMVHAVKFLKGKTYYKCTYIETEKYKYEKKVKKSIYPGLTNPINRNAILLSAKRMLKFFIWGKNPFPDTSNTDIAFHNGKLFSLWFMSGDAYELDIDTLSTIGVYRFPNENGKDQLKHKISARPRVCPRTGELFFMDFTQSWKRFRKKTIFLAKVSKDGLNMKSKKIQVSGARILHDMAITKNYIIVTDIPVKPSLKGIVEDKSTITKIGVVRRDFNKFKTEAEEKDVLWFEDTERYMIIHIVNCYEAEGKVYVYGLKKQNISINSKKTNSQNKKNESQIHAAYLHKWVLDLKLGTLLNESKSLKTEIPFPLEFPSINPQKIGLKNTYSYIVQIANANTFKYDAFFKINHESYSYEKYEYSQKEYCSQVQFIPLADNEVEDEGYLLTSVRSKTESRIEIFNAQKISEGPIAKLPLPNKIPLGFHTKWVSY